MKALLRYGAAGVIVSALLMPVVSNALTQDEVNQQINALLAQIATLSAQLKKLTPATSTPASVSTPARTGDMPITCPAIMHDIARGSSGDEVLGLQRFLQTQGFLTADSATGYYGALTQKAVGAWQKANSVLSDETSSTTVGIIGAHARAAISKACGGELPLPGGTGATMTLSRGAIPLGATADITLNTRSSCAAQNYTLDWGDGSSRALTVAAKTCAPQTVSYSHTYSDPGTYIVALSSGTMRVTIPAKITQALTCATPYFSLSGVPAGVVGTKYSLPLTTYIDPPSSVTNVTATGLPKGFSLSDVATTTTAGTKHTWSIVGTSTVATTSAVKLTAQNACGNSSVTFSIPINATLIATTQTTVTPTSNYCAAAPATPTCSTGQQLRDRGLDAYGCRLGYECYDPSAPTISVIASPSLVARGSQPRTTGDTLTINWSTQNAPTGSVVGLWLLRQSDSTNMGLIARDKAASGSYSWSIPGPQCDSNNSCYDIADSPNVNYTSPGSYFILAKLYTPTGAYLGGYPPANPLNPTYLAAAQSTTFTITTGQ